MREHANEHMNVFMPYAKGTRIENNVSRILAIALDENMLLLDRFIDIINKNLASHGEELISKPESPEDFTVEIQQTASDIAGNFDGMRRIIPVTLPPYKAEEEETKLKKKKTTAERIIQEQIFAFPAKMARKLI